MEYQEKFDLNSENSIQFGQNIDILITSDTSSNIERSQKVRNLISNSFKGITIIIDSNRQQDKFSLQVFDENKECLGNLPESIIIPNLRQFFKRSLLFETHKIHRSNICIDITSMPHILIFSLAKIFIKEVRPRNLFATYTEPKFYKRKVKERLETCIDDEDYDLYEEILGLNYNVNGFSRRKRMDDDLLVASLGFERQRLLALFDRIEPKGGLIPIVGFPSFKPGWNITAINMNYKVIEDAQAEGFIKSCESSSPFGIYTRLKEIYTKKSDTYNIMVAPFGTRPNCLGAAIFTLRHKDCQLIYDFPIEKNFRSEGADCTYFYILSCFLLD
ncbi:hypothetical protein BZG01_07005 [Labilibaculum manganireducens]|uniref:Uncharacterized protein n=1 Tax=Labilibaculum manganireducens TaxID=1940525 RepID=A0A2N3IB46_9BACT|nr:hypothetical protein [Labilibaculum manganireducens]PKQ67483.1 hypothetical protein BZG01_07005 [Labilibaculum manganireducens]